MNEQHIMGQIHDRIIKGRFETTCWQTESGQKCQPGVSDLIKQSIQKKMSVPLISSDALDRAMDDSFDKFIGGEYNVPDLVMRAKYTSEARDILTEQAGASESLNKGKFILASVEGEYHRHGMDIVSGLLKGIGFNTIELGLGVPVAEIVRCVKDYRPDYLGISGSTFSTIPLIQYLTDLLVQSDCRENITLILGGYLGLTESPESLGVDHCCHNIAETIDLLKNFAESAD
jgi:5-methyltetrahydrofolate--homocysteine methyltransferase